MVKKLKIFNNFNIPGKFKKSIILIGNFDGLHSGHQKLFELAKKYKTKYKSKVGVVTFDPIPKMFFNKKIKNYRISNFDQKLTSPWKGPFGTFAKPFVLWGLGDDCGC